MRQPTLESCPGSAQEGFAMRQVIFVSAALLTMGFMPLAATAQGEPPVAQVIGVDVDDDSEGTRVTILGNQTPTFSAYQLSAPPRLFVDFSNTELQGEITNWTVRNGTVEDVLILQYQDEQSLVTRVVITLSEDDVLYDVAAVGNDVVISASLPSAAPSVATDSGSDLSDEAFAEYEAALRALQGYQRELANQQIELERLTEASTGSQSMVQDLSAELSQLREELASRDEAIRDASIREAELRNVVSELEGQGDQTELEAALRQREAQSFELRNLEAEYDGLLSAAEETHNNLNEAETALADVAQQRISAQQRVAATSDSMDGLSTDVQRLQAEADQREAQLLEQRTALRRLEGEMADVAERESEQRRRAEALAQQVATMESELDTARAGENAANSELVDLRDRSAAEASRLEAAAAESARAQQAVSEARTALGQTESLLAQQQTENREVQNELEEVLLERERLTAQLDALEAEQLGQEGELIEARREHAILITETAELAETRAETERQLEEAQAEQAEAVAALSDLEQQRLGVTNELAELSERRQAMAAEIDTLEQRLVAVQGDGQVTATDAATGSETAPTHDGTAGTVQLTDVRFEQTGGIDRVVLDFSGQGADVQSMPWVDGRAALLVRGAELPDALRRTLDTRAFEGPVHFISSFADEDGVHIVAELGSAASEILAEDGSHYSWEFSSPVAAWSDGGELDGYNSQEETTSAPAINRTGLSYTIGDASRADALRVPRLARRYRVTIDVVNARVTDILRLFSDQGDVNIVASQGVSGVITLRLRSVPLDEAFALILQSQNLDFEQRGNILRVAPIDEFEAERARAVDARARQFQLEPLQIRLRPISYAQGGSIIGHINSLLSNRGSVAFDDRTHTLIMRDVAENLDAAEQLIDALDTQTPQILIEARIVQTGESFTRGFGIQWGGDTLFSPANGNATGLLFPSTIGISGGAGQAPNDGTSASPNYAVNIPGPGTGAIGFQFGSLGQAVNLNLRLSAAEQTGSAKVVSAPRILTLDGQSASISSGVSIPVQSTGAAGANVTFVNASLSLSVTPTVTPDGYVHLQLTVSKNEPDFARTGSNGDPTIVTRSTNTQLLVRDGETSVIGGIFEHVTGSDQNAVPFFADIPILGALFHDYQYTDERSETLVFITPRIVNRDVSLTNYTPGGVFMTPSE